MRSVRWRKVLRDFSTYRVRTAAVVASIAVGVIAIGTPAGANALLAGGFADAAAQGRPAASTISTATGFDAELVDTIRRMDGVEDAEARQAVSAWLVPRGGTATGGATPAAAGGGPAGGATDIQLVALQDAADQRVDRVLPQTGHFPPGRGEIVLERSAQRLVDVREGDRVMIRTASGEEHPLRVAGLAYEPGASPAFYFGRLTGYVTQETLVDLGWPDTYNELRIRTTPAITDIAAVQRLTDEVRQRLERAGTPVMSVRVATPGRHPAEEIIQAVFLVLGAIGFLSLFVAGFLIVNTINVLMAQHIRQIGIMKVLGGRFRQIAALYLALVALYALVALCFAVPVAALASLGLASLAAGLLNVDLARTVVPPEVVALEVAAGLSVPLLAALFPIRRGVRITVHAALTDTGLDERFGHGAMDRLLTRVQGLSRPLLLSIRSTFRRKGRLALTLAALTVGGAVFMTIFSVRGSLFATLADTARYFDYDVQVQLSEPVRATTVLAEAMRVPGTVAAEPWRFASAIRERPDGAESPTLVMFGLPAETATVQPIVREGRWLLPGEGNALVATANIRRDDPDLDVGDEVTLKIGDRDTRWTLVGLVQSPTMVPFLYVDTTTLGALTGGLDRAGMVMVKTGSHDATSQAETAAALRSHLEASGIGVAATTTTSDVMNTVYLAFDTLVIVVTAMALLLGVIGGLGLTGTMTMNVVERSREIGIIRAIGATDGAVRRIFVGEGVVIGVIAWALGALLSLPLSKVLSDMLGEAFVQRPLSFSPSIAGLALWLAIVVVLSVLGSLVPAWRASRIAVREVLGYE
jgi:putative ABC transport system permease protein